MSAVVHSGVCPDLKPLIVAGHFKTSNSHRLAIFIPLARSDYGEERLIQSLHVCLAANPVPFDVFLLAQSDKNLRNLGALLNAGARLLNGTVYTHFSWLTERFVCPAYAVRQSACCTTRYVLAASYAAIYILI